MTYWVNLFTGKTWDEFLAAGGNVSGHREGRWTTVQKIRPGDHFLCYVTGVSRWIGLLEVTGEPYQDTTPIWTGDTFPCRLPVEVKIALEPEYAIPVRSLDDRLSYFLNATAPMGWTGHFRSSPTREKEADALVVVRALEEASENPVRRPVDKAKWARGPKTYESVEGPVTIPEEDTTHSGVGEVAVIPVEEETISHEEIQSLLLRLGSEMGFGLWVAKNDKNKSYKGRAFSEIPGMKESLPAQFDPATNKTVELIDVLWLDGNAIAAAFEVEHTTSIYSGLLRMADLVAMQPNLKIRLFLVAPDARRDKVLEEIGRPTFSRGMKPPLHEHCQYIPYSKLKEKEEQLRDMLKYMKSEWLDEIAESASPSEG